MLLLALAVACSDSGSPSPLQMAQSEYDLGTVSAGSTHRTRFPFEVGNAPIPISKVQRSCGCSGLVAVVDGEPFPLPGVLPADSAGHFELEFRTAGFSGEKRVAVELQGDAPALPVTMAVTAVIEPYFEAMPPAVQFGETDGQTALERELVVRAPDPFRFTRVAHQPPGLLIEGVPSASRSREQVVTVRLEEGMREGEWRWMPSLQTDRSLDLVFPVEVRVRGDLWTEPARVVQFGQIPPGIAAQATVMVGSQSGRLSLPGVRVEGVEGATVDCATVESNSRYRVRIFLPDDLPSGPFSGRLLLDLHTPDADTESATRSLIFAGVVRPLESP